MDSNDKPFEKEIPYKILGKRNGNGQETTFFATFIGQESGSYILIQTEPGNIFCQYFSDIRSIKPVTFLDRVFLYINLQLSIMKSNE